MRRASKENQLSELAAEKLKSVVNFLSADSYDRVLKEQKHLVVDFYGVPCPPCRALAPVYSEMAEKFCNCAHFANINVYEAKEIAQRYNIRGVPTIIVFEDGKEKVRITGLCEKRVLEEFLKTNLSSIPAPITKN